MYEAAEKWTGKHSRSEGPPSPGEESHPNPIDAIERVGGYMCALNYSAQNSMRDARWGGKALMW